MPELDIKDRILDTVRKIEGFRDGYYHYDALEARAEFIEKEFASFGLSVEQDEFIFNARSYRNIIATAPGSPSEEAPILVGAHYDAVMGSPGADDNASGVAVMLETARILGPLKKVHHVAFSLEEPQPDTLKFLIGSKHFVHGTKSRGSRYKAVFILESVGYVDDRQESQKLPPFVKAPRVGNFIGVVGSRRSRGIMEKFAKTAAMCVPELKVVTYKAPLRGYVTPEARFSDHAPFWDAGYPAVMITDTAMFRNPHYHTRFDVSETLSAEFMAQVAEALISTIREL